MAESMKNREFLAVGTRVKLAFNKESKHVGTVTEHGQHSITVHWDGQKHPFSGYRPFELKEVK